MVGVLAGKGALVGGRDAGIGATGGDDDAWVAAATALSVETGSLTSSSMMALLSILEDEAARTRITGLKQLRRWIGKRPRTSASPTPIAEGPQAVDAPAGGYETKAWNQWIGADATVDDSELILSDAPDDSNLREAANDSIPGIDRLVGTPGSKAQPVAWYARYARTMDLRYLTSLITLKRVAVTALERQGHPAGMTGEPVEAMRLARTVAKGVRSAIRKVQKQTSSLIGGNPAERPRSEDLELWHWHDVLRSPPLQILGNLPS